MGLPSNRTSEKSSAFSQAGLEPPRQLSAAPSLSDRYRVTVQHVLGYIEPRTTSERYVIATGGSDEAANFMVATGRPVLPIGGYSG